MANENQMNADIDFIRTLEGSGVNVKNLPDEITVTLDKAEYLYIMRRLSLVKPVVWGDMAMKCMGLFIRKINP